MRLPPLPPAAIAALQEADREAAQRHGEYQARARAQREAEVKRAAAAIKAHQAVVDARQEVEFSQIDFEDAVVRCRCLGESSESHIELAEGRLARAHRELRLSEIAHAHWQSPGFR